MGRLYAGILGPLAFATILARGLIDAGAAQHTLAAATSCLFLFAGIGYLAGQLAEFIVADSVRARIREELRRRETATGENG